MKKPNLQRLAQRSKIYLRKASPTILSGLGAAGVSSNRDWCRRKPYYRLGE